MGLSSICKTFNLTDDDHDNFPDSGGGGGGGGKATTNNNNNKPRLHVSPYYFY